MEIIGYLASIVIGITLGLLGGGGSILIVPVLVYIFKVPPVLATAYSLFIVGTSSLLGAIPKYKQGCVSLRTTIVFGIPSIISVFITRKYLIPNIPDTIVKIGNTSLTKPLLMMLMFAVLMLFASISMIRNNKNNDENKLDEKQSFNYPLILIEGITVGALTGFVGAGGGFMIVPALVILSKLPMKKAIGTSLLIIALKSLIGFLGDLTQENQAIEWNFLLWISLLAILGIFIGNRLSLKIQAKKLKKTFGWFVLIMGVLILLKEGLENIF